MFLGKTQNTKQITRKNNRFVGLLKTKFMVQICVFFCTIAFPQKIHAQLFQMWDSVKYYMHDKPTLTGDFDSKNTFVTGKGVSMKGLELGVNYGNKISYMLGWYFLSAPINSNSTLYKGTINEATYDTKVRIHYLSVIAEYSLLKNHNWNINMPIQIGIGTAKKEFSIANTLKLSQKSTILPVEITFRGNYRVWKFIGLSAGLGYRRAFSANIIKDEDFNGIMYTLGVKVWIGDLCRWVDPKCIYCKDL
jgi:hypothetical protein